MASLTSPLARQDGDHPFREPELLTDRHRADGVGRRDHGPEHQAAPIVNSGTIHSEKKATTNAVTNTIPTPRRKIGGQVAFEGRHREFQSGRVEKRRQDHTENDVGDRVPAAAYRV